MKLKVERVSNWRNHGWVTILQKFSSYHNGMQLSVTQRKALFWLVCIPTRLYLASRGNDPLLRGFAVVVATRWLRGLEVGNEGVLGGTAFWADERPLHGVLWGGYAATGNNGFLYADTAFGAVNWVSHYLM